MEREATTEVLDPRQVFVACDPVPRRSVIALSAFAHCALLALIVVFGHIPRARILPPKYDAVQIISGPPQLSFNSAKATPTRPYPSLSRAHRSRRQPPAPQPGTAEEGSATEILREHAKQATAAIVTSIKQRQIYGFSPDNYQLPAHVSGEIPSISAAGLPPRFEQYVIVEITIDVDGRVADARIVTGLVDPTIQRTLLSAIREFKYSPAKRDGTPIPSQLDLVIHIPT
jgi:TonB family protein